MSDAARPDRRAHRGATTHTRAPFLFPPPAPATITTGVITSAVRTTFVSLALNPNAMAAVHPAEYAALATAWAAAQPEAWAYCGYGTRVFVGPAV